MASPVKKTRLHQLPEFTGDKTGGIVLFSLAEKEYQMPVSQLGGGSSDDDKPIQNISGADGVVGIDPNLGDDFIIALNDPTSAVTIAAITNPVVGKRYEIQLTFKQNTGANKVTFPASVKWPNGADPVLSYTKDAEDVLSLSSTDGGQSWKGAIFATGY